MVVWQLERTKNYGSRHYNERELNIVETTLVEPPVAERDQTLIFANVLNRVTKMKTSFTTKVSCFVLFVFLICGPLHAQRSGLKAPVKNRVAHTVRVNGQLMEKDQIYLAELDLGTLDKSMKLNVVMTLKNPLDKDVKFSDVSKKCSCSSFRPQDYVIPAGGQETVHFSIKTPSRSRNQTVTQKIRFVEDGSTVVRADLKFKLKGFIAFKEPMGFLKFQADDEYQELSIPFLYSAPVKFEDIKAKASENLGDLDFSMERTESGGVLKAKLSDKIFSQGTIRGEVYLSTESGKNRDGYFLVVQDLAKDEISPKVLSFKRKSNSLTASAIVQIANRGQEISDSPIQCDFDGKAIPVDVKMLKKNTYRVQLNLDEALAKEMSMQKGNEDAEPMVIDWSINNGKTTSQHTTSFVIDTGS